MKCWKVVETDGLDRLKGIQVCENAQLCCRNELEGCRNGRARQIENARAEMRNAQLVVETSWKVVQLDRLKPWKLKCKIEIKFY